MRYIIYTFVLSMLMLTSSAQKLEWAYAFTNSNIQDMAGSMASNGSEFAVCGTIVNNFSVDLKNHHTDYNAKKCFISRYDKDANIKWVVEQPGGGSNTP